MLQPPQQFALGRVDVDITQTGARSLKRVPRKVQRVSNDKVIADSLHIERHKVAWQTIVGERLVVIARVTVVVGAAIVAAVIIALQLHRLESVVVDIDAPLQKISNVEVSIAIDERRGKSRVA